MRRAEGGGGGSKFSIKGKTNLEKNEESVHTQ